MSCETVIGEDSSGHGSGAKEKSIDVSFHAGFFYSD